MDEVLKRELHGVKASAPVPEACRQPRTNSPQYPKHISNQQLLEPSQVGRTFPHADQIRTWSW